jgi:hypothetical protein
VDAASAAVPPILLVKLIRFRRGYEVMFYSENVLGSVAAEQVRQRPVDPTQLFSQEIISRDDVFFFRDHTGRDFRDVQCTLLPTRAEAGALKLRLRKIDGRESVRFPKRGGGYRDKPLPCEGSAKTVAKTILVTVGGVINRSTK